MSQLKQRVLTAVALLTSLLLVLFAAPLWVGVAASAGVMILAAWEWSAFVGLQQPAARTLYAAGTAVVLALSGWLVPANVNLALVLWTALAWWALAFLWIVRFPVPISRVVAGVAGVLVLVSSWLATVAILSTPNHGPALVLWALSVVFAADIGAYFAGQRFGRVKLAPRVSPGKTWEGLLGGLALAALTAAVGGAMLDLEPLVMVPVGLAVGTLSVIGDLTVSMFKRSVGVKDSGHLIPGHGGVLDRLDSITAAMPLFALILSWIGLTP